MKTPKQMEDSYRMAAISIAGMIITLLIAAII